MRITLGDLLRAAQVESMEIGGRRYTRDHRAAYDAIGISRDGQDYYVLISAGVMPFEPTCPTNICGFHQPHPLGRLAIFFRQDGQVGWSSVSVDFNPDAADSLNPPYNFRMIQGGMQVYQTLASLRAY